MSLDPESEQVREVYAYYGLAMYWAQCVEQSIFPTFGLFRPLPESHCELLNIGKVGCRV